MLYKKIGLMGGTFDPIHNGHLIVSETVMQKLNLEKIIFIPTGFPNHKKDKYITDAEQRYFMTVLATLSNPNFDVSRIEIDRKGLTYTIDTIIELKNNYGNHETEFYFIMGADSIHEMLTWKEPEKLIKTSKFVGVTRPGYDKKILEQKINNLNETFSDNIIFLEVPEIEVSSTDIRNKILNKNSIKYLVSEEVERFIYKNKVYDIKDFIEMAKIKVKNDLSEKRYNHTLGVAFEAKKLAHNYGIDEEKAELAAILHDMAKEFTTEQIYYYCDKYNIILDDTIKSQLYLAHGIIGANISKHELSINDKDIFNAIEFHTTGRKNMSLFEKIIFLADGIEPNREEYPELKEIRRKAYKNIDDAIILFLELSISYNANKGCNVHHLSVDALNFLKETNNK